MSEHQMETRRRSRSKTPFLRSNCDHETCEHAGEEGHSHQPKKKTAAVLPNVQTIVEETVKVTSSSSPLGKQSQQKIKTSDYSSEDNSPENKLKSRSFQESHQKQSSSFSTTTTSTTIVTKSKKMSNLGAFTSTPKGSDNYDVESFSTEFAGTMGGEGVARRREIMQNRMNAEFERSQQQETAINTSNGKNNSNSSSRSQNNSSFSRIFGTSFGSASRGEQQNSNGDVNEHLAYKEYVRAGEYWKTTPKTDYTYSELSPHRRLLAPGVVAMPNMSRRSLENHHDRINYMVERDPGQESYIRRRYEATKYSQNRRDTNKLIYDSSDELDKSYHYYNTHKMSHEESWFMRIITTVVTTFTSIWSSVSGGGGSAVDESTYYSTNFATEERGFFGLIAHGISSFFGGIFRSIYLFISSVLRFDTWLLQSTHAESRGRKRFLLFLLMLLPLLLLAGLYYHLHPNEPFPPTSFSKIETFTLPTINMSEYLNSAKFEELKANAYNRWEDFRDWADMSEYLNSAKFDELKANAYNRWEDFRDWTDDYLLYLRTVSQNIANEGRKLFRREQYYDRV